MATNPAYEKASAPPSGHTNGSEVPTSSAQPTSNGQTFGVQMISGYSGEPISPVNKSSSSGGACLSKKVIIAIICVIVIAGAIVGIVFGTKAAKDAGKVTIVIQSANTKEKWLDSVINDFNNDKIKTDDGKKIVIEVEHTGSTLKPKLKPNIWSPQNKAFIEIQSRQDGITYVSNINQLCSDTTDVPVGVGMWKHLAEQLGWPNTISFEAIGNLAVNPNGWGSVSPSLAGFGDFKYGHGHPNSSNSGRLSVMATMMAFSNSTTSLNSVLEVDNAANDADVKAIIQSVVHLGKIDTDLLARMRDHGISYLHAVANYESNIINWNLDYAQQINSHGFGGWVFIYLDDGTFWMNNPLCVIDYDGYSTPEQVEAAKKFTEYATSQDKLKNLLQYGLRPTSSAQIEDITCCGSTITQANGADPSKSLENMDLLLYPDDNIVEYVLSTWNDIKKPAAFAVVIDTSGSMRETDGFPFSRLHYARQALVTFVQSTNDRDYIDLRGFGSVKFNTPGLKRNVSDDAVTWINGLTPNGGTPLYETMKSAWDTLNALKVSNEAQGIDWNYAIIPMTDGEPGDIPTYNDFFSAPYSYPTSVESSNSPDIIHIFPIIFGGDATGQETNFRTLASVSGGKFFSADNDDISDIYFQLSLEI